MKNKKTTKKLRSWSALKKDRFHKDTEEAIAYLKATLEENGDIPEIVIEAIREVSESLGMSIEQIAKKANKTPSTIHKALSKSGNPTLGTLTAVLKTMGLRLSVEKAS
ncbi:DNA-binding protein [Bdellovibrio sp. HCB288]|uniref:helix-turn-helix domain-containing transcriptional regulator n=1 Tax=Bdellovibrio sp. HCB288 TaxID=3394355 RepID=UPI0039B57367